MAELYKVLCVGTPPDLRASRQLVLEYAGYETISMDAVEAINALQTSRFDFIVISATVPERERPRLRQAIPQQTRIIQLGDFTPPEELLALIQAQPAN